MNLNDLSNEITNFKIKFTKDPSPIEVSNIPVVFLAKNDDGYYSVYQFDSIKLSDEDTIDIKLK